MPPAARLLPALVLAAVALLVTGCGAALSPRFTPPEAGGARWHEVISAHFRLQTDLPAAEARATTEELERMYAALLDLGFPYEAKPPGRTRVVVFRREAEYKAVAPFGTVGFFGRVRLDSAGVEPVAVTWGELTRETRRVLQHELTHRFVRFYFPKAPPWLNEGLAHYFETLEVDGGHAILGRPAFTFVRGLGFRGRAVPTAAAVPAHDVIRLGRADLDIDRGRSRGPEEERREARRAHAARASAWALVHLLKNGPPAYAPKLEALLRDLGLGKAPGAAWAAAFGEEAMATLDADLAASLAPAGREIRLLRAAYAPPPPLIEGAREMAPADVHLLWSFMKGRDPDTEVAAALSLAPESVPALRARAALHDRMGRFEEGERDLERALALRPGDPLTLFRLFDHLAGRSLVRGAAPAHRIRAEGLLPDLLPQASSSAAMASDIAGTLGAWGQVDEALPLALRAVELDPSQWKHYDTLAALLAKKGATAKAVEAQELALSLMPDEVHDDGAVRRMSAYRAALAEPAPPEELSAAVVRAVIKRRHEGYQRCYADGLGRAPKLEGKVSVRLTIERDGSVSSARDEGSTLPDPAVVACIAGEMSGLRFPPREKGVAASVLHTMPFSPTTSP